MEQHKVFFEEKSDLELEQMLRAYLTGSTHISEAAVFSLCEVLAARKMPPASPAEVYRSHLAACFPDAVNTNT